ncbi:MAG TPA: DUF3156 family protein [Actinomycetota bacterium]
MRGRASRRAAAVLADDVRAFGALGYRAGPRHDPLRARLSAEGRPDLRIVLAPTGGRVFGGTFAMEASTAEPVLPATGGVTARGRGAVRLQGFRFRGRDETGRSLAERLEADGELVKALSAVHFEQIRVEPDGRAVIRHMGGSLVWLLFPPMARPIPIVPEQVWATVAALEAFERAGRSARR